MSATKRFRLNRPKARSWDEQIYCVPSEEFRFNSLIRDGNVGKTDPGGNFAPKID